VECFKPFLLHLLSLELSCKTDNLWILAEEITRNLHEDSPLRKHPLNTWLGDRR